MSHRVQEAGKSVSRRGSFKGDQCRKGVFRQCPIQKFNVPRARLYGWQVVFYCIFNELVSFALWALETLVPKTGILLPKKKVIVVGVPNVGKSTVINKIRTASIGKKVKAVRTGALPGITKATVSLLIHNCKWDL